MWPPVMALLSRGLLWRAERSLAGDILERPDPVQSVISPGQNRVLTGWRKVIWRRIGLIAADFYKAPNRSSENGAKALLFATSKVPDAPRLQLSAAEFLAHSRQSQLPDIFNDIAERFSDNADAQRARLRIMTRLRGRRAAQEFVLASTANEPPIRMMARAQGLEDLGEFTSADQIWETAFNAASALDKPEICLAYADSLAQRGWVGRALMMANELPSKSKNQRVKDWSARLAKVNATDNIDLYLPAHTAEQLFNDIAERRVPSERGMRKKIVLINASLGRGGAERQCVNTAIGLAKAKPDLIVEVWVRNLDRHQSRNALLPELEKAGVRVRAIDRFSDLATPLTRDWPGVDETLLTENLPFLGPTAFRIYNGLKSHKPDVVHLWQDASIALMGLSVLWANVPHIALSLRSLPPPMKGADRPYYRPLISGIAHAPGVSLSANSFVGRDAYAEWLGVSPEKIAVIHNALSPKARNVRQKKSSDQRVIGVMRFDENKRPDVWIKVAENVSRQLPEVKFELIGDGPLAVEIGQALDASDAVEHITLSGDVENVWPRLKDADILLHLARVEGLPNALIEAQAAGCAVIATDAGGTREAFLPGHSGELLLNSDVLNIDEISSQLVSLLTDTDRLTKYQTQARDFISKRFHLDEMVKSTLALYGLK